MKPAIVCLCGGIGSGKTEVSTQLSKRLAWKRAGFGDYVRAVAIQRSIPEERESLQQLGESLIASSLRQFCAAVLDTAEWSPGEAAVVDGIRHVEALNVIRELVAPVTAPLIYLALPDEIRVARLSDARPSDGARLEQLDLHSTEVQVKTALREIADLVIDATRPRDEVVAEICEWLDRR